MKVNAMRMVLRIHAPIDEQFEADYDYQQIGGGLKARKTVQQLDEHGGRKAHQDKTQNAAGNNDPKLWVRTLSAGRRAADDRDRRQYRVDRKRDVGHLDDGDGAPESWVLWPLEPYRGSRSQLFVLLLGCQLSTGFDIDKHGCVIWSERNSLRRLVPADVDK